MVSELCIVSHSFFFHPGKSKGVENATSKRVESPIVCNYLLTTPSNLRAEIHCWGTQQSKCPGEQSIVPMNSVVQLLLYGSVSANYWKTLRQQPSFISVSSHPMQITFRKLFFLCIHNYLCTLLRYFSGWSGLCHYKTAGRHVGKAHGLPGHESCSSKFPMPVANIIHKNFWDIKDFILQNTYIQKTSRGTLWRGSGMCKTLMRPSATAVCCSLSHSDQVYSVCKKSFLCVKKISYTHFKTAVKSIGGILMQCNICNE